MSKRIISLVIAIATVLTLCSCGKENKKVNNESKNNNGLVIQADLPEITFTKNTVSPPEYQALPDLKYENEKYTVSVHGYETVDFDIPMTIEEYLKKTEGSRFSNTLYLNDIPEFDYDFPKELTDEALAQFTECEIKLTSVKAEKAYTNADGTVYMTYGSSMTGNKQYIYQLSDSNGDNIAWIYYDGNTRKITSVNEFTYDYKDQMVEDNKCTRNFYYTDGLLTNITIDAESTYYSENAKNSDKYSFEKYKAEANYIVKDGKLNGIDDCILYMSCSVWDLTDSNDTDLTGEGFNCYFDNNGNLSGIMCTKYATKEDKANADSITYYYILAKKAWYTEDGEKVEQ